jgi:GrpB-like predicted nucleotidyltransferase (UPF0157 family)
MTESEDNQAVDPHSSDDIVFLQPYDDDWPKRAATEATLLKEANLPGWRTVEHVGSTAIPGMSAKPIIDLALAVDCDIIDPNLLAGLSAIGYRHLGNFGLPGREFFRKGQPTNIHLHVVRVGSEHWDAWMRLRDFLRSNPTWLERYQEEKLRLASTYRQNRAAYTLAKGEIVRQILDAAEELNF